MDQIVYQYHQNLYINLTNRCPCACVFCERQYFDGLGSADSLWLKEEPSVEQVMKALGAYDLSDYKELVFCGFGEPAERLMDLTEIAKKVKKHSAIPIRMNTIGLADLIWDRPCAPLLKDAVDRVSISLNTPDPKRFQELTRSRFGEKSWFSLVHFAKECAQNGLEVRLTTVATTLTEEEEEQCRRLAESIGAEYLIRPYEEPGVRPE